MALTVEQALALAPDGSSASAGRKLGSPKTWRNLGRSEAALWGECQGSALYQVRVDLGDLATKCSCPSRKFPCKHALGLLILAANDPAALPDAAPPEWVADWLERRVAAGEKAEAQAAKRAAVAEEVAADPAKAERAESRKANQRLKRVTAGIDALDRWLEDLIRNGLAGVEGQSARFWTDQGKRLVDAQAPGLAGRVRRMADIPHATPDWTSRLLDELGRLTLLTHAFRRLDELDPPLQDDVRSLIGWTLDAEEVVARGEIVRDEWAVVGRRISAEENLRTQWNWLVGRDTARRALVLQFAHGAAAFKEPVIPGVAFTADLAFWPSANPQRALIHARHGQPSTLSATIPGAATIAEFLQGFAEATARQPWLERDLAVLHAVTPIVGGEGPWLLRDATGAALPLAKNDHWRLLALSGGHPVTLAAEWDGTALLPLGTHAEGEWHILNRED